MRLLLLTAVLLAACATTASGAEAPPLRGRLVSIEAGASVPAALPAARSTALDEPQELSRLERPSPAPPVAAPQQSGGVAALVGADQWHEAGFSGRGVRVAVIDTGFSGYEEEFGDTVPPVRARSFRADGGLGGGSGHGLRAAQIVRELAPRAELLLLAFSTVDPNWPRPSGTPSRKRSTSSRSRSASYTTGRATAAARSTRSSTARRRQASSGRPPPATGPSSTGPAPSATTTATASTSSARASR